MAVVERLALQFEIQALGLEFTKPLEVSDFNGKVVVQGQLVSMADYQRLKTLLAGETDVVSLVGLENIARSRVVAREKAR